MAQGTYYFDTATFASATSIFTDANLTVCAGDGYYSDGIISRQLLGCRLLTAVLCPNCAATPTPTAVPTATPVPPTPAPTPVPTPTPGPSVVYYTLVGCVNSAGVTPASGYIASLPTDEPGNTQRYVDSSATPSKFYTYNNTFPALPSVNQSLILPSSLEALTGLFGCPAISTTFTYQLRACLTNETEFFFTTEVEFGIDTRVQQSSATGVFYTVEASVSSVGATWTELSGVACVQENGRCLTGCPALPPDPVAFVCSDATFTVEDGTVGQSVSASIVNGNIEGAITPSTYQSGSQPQAYSANIRITATSVDRSGIDTPINNNGALIPCSANATAIEPPVTPNCTFFPNVLGVARGYSATLFATVTCNTNYYINFASGSDAYLSFSVDSNTGGPGGGPVNIYFDGNPNATGLVQMQLKEGNNAGTVLDTCQISIQLL